MENIDVYAFVGPSGTGKSYRAQMVANTYNIKFIIDDGILIKDNYILEGNSAKKAPTKIETVKRALFTNEEQRKEMVNALKRAKPKSILVLGTSDKMVIEIVQNLELPQIKKIIRIEDVATEDEMETARRIRVTEGKHVIPVPTFEIKKDFSGYLLDPLQIFKSNGFGNRPYISEKSIIRPTFSYIGNFTISDSFFKEIIEYISKKSEAITEIIRIIINKTDEGPTIYVEVKVKYGFNFIFDLSKFKERCIKEIERETAMNVVSMKVIAKKIELPKLPTIEDITNSID